MGGRRLRQKEFWWDNMEESSLSRQPSRISRGTTTGNCQIRSVKGQGVWVGMVVWKKRRRYTGRLSLFDGCRLFGLVEWYVNKKEKKDSK